MDVYSLILLDGCQQFYRIVVCCVGNVTALGDRVINVISHFPYMIKWLYGLNANITALFHLVMCCRLQMISQLYPIGLPHESIAPNMFIVKISWKLLLSVALMFIPIFNVKNIVLLNTGKLLVCNLWLGGNYWTRKLLTTTLQQKIDYCL